MNDFSKTLSYLLISSAIILSGCQSMAEPTNTSSDNIKKLDPITADTPISEDEATAIVAIIEKYDAEMVFIAPKPHEQKIEVGACFYKKISAELKSRIENELSQAIAKNVVVTPSAHLTLPIGVLDESVYQHDPCVY